MGQGEFDEFGVVLQTASGHLVLFPGRLFVWRHSSRHVGSYVTFGFALCDHCPRRGRGAVSLPHSCASGTFRV